jgi:hypothetical protein
MSMTETSTPAPTLSTQSRLSGRHSGGAVGQASVPFAVIVCFVAVVVCAYAFISFATAETVTVANRLSIGLAFALSLSSGVAVSHVVEARGQDRS